MEPNTNPAPVAPKKSSKALFGVIGVLVLLVIIVIASRSFSGANYKIQGVEVDQNLDGSATYTSKEGTVSVGTNKMPDNWPSDAPTYPNANLKYAASSNQSGDQGSSINFTSSDSAEKIVTYYKVELAAKGWTVEQEMTTGATTVLSAKKDNRSFGVYIITTDENTSSVTVGIGGI